MSLTLVVTDAGRAALINAEANGLAPVTISQVAVSATHAAVTTATTALTGELKRLTTIAGGATAADTLHVTILDESVDVYALHAFALFLDDGTLFAIYSAAVALMTKTAGIALLGAFDIVFSDIAATSLTFGDTNFSLGPATETNQGVIELATEAEAIAGTDDVRAVTPATMAAAIAAAADLFIPVGLMAPLAGDTAPDGWLICDGAEKNRADHPRLWAFAQVSGNLAADGTEKTANPGMFGPGDGTDTFDLPEISDFVRGLGARAVGSFQLDAVQEFTVKTEERGGGGSGHGLSYFDDRGSSSDDLNDTIEGVGQPLRTATETRPRNTAYPYIIKT